MRQFVPLQLDLYTGLFVWNSIQAHALPRILHARHHGGHLRVELLRGPRFPDRSRPGGSGADVEDHVPRLPGADQHHHQQRSSRHYRNESGHDQGVYAEYRAGRMSEQEAKDLVRAGLSSQTIGNSGYFTAVEKREERLYLDVHPFLRGEDCTDTES